MGDTTGDPAGDCVCGKGGTAVAIPGPDPIYRCSGAHGIFPDYAVPPTTLQLGYGQAAAATADLSLHLGLPPGRVVASPRAWAGGTSADTECILRCSHYFFLGDP